MEALTAPGYGLEKKDGLGFSMSFPFFPFFARVAPVTPPMVVCIVFVSHLDAFVVCFIVRVLR